MSEEVKLRECPFCKGEARVVRVEKVADGQEVPKGTVAQRAYCTKCQVRQHGFQNSTKAEAIAAWNTRAADEQIAELVGALSGMVEIQDIMDDVGHCDTEFFEPRVKRARTILAKHRSAT